MKISGKQLIAGRETAASTDSFKADNPATGDALEPAFFEATVDEVDQAVEAAREVFDSFRSKRVEARADFLDAIADEILALGDEFLERTAAETGYPLARCSAERDRAITHTRQFANLIREGSWLDARVDLPDPTRKPFPKPDVRSLMQPLGPVAVFGADTMSALASGCPVVVKGHPAHPGTCEIASRAIYAAAEKTRMPAGVFSLIQGRGHEVGIALVQHPDITAAAFTGSLAGGRALFDIANRRPVPIPFYAEMGSVNPLFILPGALKGRATKIADGFVAALTQGNGQFCTNPGIVLGNESDDWQRFSALVKEKVEAVAPATMLHAGIHEAYRSGVEARRNNEALQVLAHSSENADDAKLEAAAYLFETTQEGLAGDPTLFSELFGPCSTLVSCGGIDDMIAVAKSLEGNLSVTIHGTEEDLANHKELVSILQTKTGRLIFNGYPVGLEVCHSIHHGGPYPATTHSHYTSVGTRAIERFVRPVCYQDWPDAMLPIELQNANPRGVLRLLNSHRTRDAV